MATTALQPIDTTAVTIPANQVSALPSIAEVKQRMTWMTEFRPVLLEYVQTHMDPARHMYSFENNRYTPLTLETLKGMMAEGKKPALNQDGIHNLMSLYDCYTDEPTIHETREDGFYTCRATIKLMSFRTGLPMGAGTGSCSTRESRYAYRWVGKSRLPRGVNGDSLRQREMSGRSGGYTQYRLDNEDIADVEATVLQMAVKRAKSSAVKALPLVSEMFAGIGDVDEETRKEEEARQTVLGQVGAWMRGLPTAVRMKAILAVFGQPLRVDDVAKLDEETLTVGLQTVEIATRQGVDWKSPTLVVDLKQALSASAAQAHQHLFGDGSGASATAGAPREVVNVATGEVSPAGEDGAPYMAQIEAAILAQHADIEPWYVWAERKYRKPRAQFTVGDWEAFLLQVRGTAAKTTHTPPPGPPQGTHTATGDSSEPEPGSSTIDDPGSLYDGERNGPSWGPESPNLWEEEDGGVRGVDEA